MALTPSEKLKLANQITAVLDAGLEGQTSVNVLGAEILLLAAKARVTNGQLVAAVTATDVERYSSL